MTVSAMMSMIYGVGRYRKAFQSDFPGKPKAGILQSGCFMGREEIKCGINVVLQMTQPLMLLQRVFTAAFVSPSLLLLFSLW